MAVKAVMGGLEVMEEEEIGAIAVFWELQERTVVMEVTEEMVLLEEMEEIHQVLLLSYWLLIPIL